MNREKIFRNSDLPRLTESVELHRDVMLVSRKEVRTYACKTNRIKDRMIAKMDKQGFRVEKIEKLWDAIYVTFVK